jgi:multiple sugar transport system permease protein/putative aldouronate transport system permease protein
LSGGWILPVKLYGRVLPLRRNAALRDLQEHWVLYLMCLPALTLLIMFAFVPYFGICIAFNDFNVLDGIFNSPFVGLQHFKNFFRSGMAYIVTWNTLVINFFGIIFGTIVPILLAISLSEVRNRFFKRLTQSFMFFPYFLSWVVIGNLIYSFLANDVGVVNKTLASFGLEGVRWYASPQYWKAILISADLWKWAGYSSIIYLAAMSNFDPTMYEAAKVDGASRFQQVWYLTIPMLKPTVVVLVLMSVGRIFYGDFGMVYGVVRDNPLLADTTTIIDTYVYSSMRIMGFSYATAVGLMQSVLGLILVVGANSLAKKINDGEGLF